MHSANRAFHLLSFRCIISTWKSPLSLSVYSNLPHLKLPRALRPDEREETFLTESLIILPSYIPGQLWWGIYCTIDRGGNEIEKNEDFFLSKKFSFFVILDFDSA